MYPASLALLLFSAAACGSSHGPEGEGTDAGLPRADGATPGTDGGRPRDGGTSMRTDGASATDAARRDGGPDSGLPPRMVTCADDPPDDAVLPAPLPTYAGTCPTLTSGFNTITSSGAARQFRVVVPEGATDTERFPVLFLWHWLGGDADSFYERGEVQPAADLDRFVAVIPEAKGDLMFKWPFASSVSAARFDEELQFFDDMLACVAEQFAINQSCVGSIGVSAGALWTSQLAGHRAQSLSSFVSLSGGTGGLLARDFHPPSHRLPGIVLWGGPSDWCGENFEDTSHDLEMHLESGGHFFVECIHDCGHAEPPLEAPPGASKYAAIWRFVLQHPYWLRAGESPYLVSGLPDDLPDWCGIGRGSATPRVGDCPGSACL